MNLVGTLAKVAMGVMVARGLGKVMGGKGGGGGLGSVLGGAKGGASSGGGLGGLLGGITGGKVLQQGGNTQSSGQQPGRSLDDLLGGTSAGRGNTNQHQDSCGPQGGAQAGAQAGAGGLGGLLGGLLGGQAQQGGSSAAGGGDIGSILGGILSGGAKSAGQSGGGLGGLGGLLEQLGGKQAGAAGAGGLGALLNQALGGQKIDPPAPDQNAQAEIMLRAMINAAKSDGEIDQEEQQKILGHLGDVTQDELNFVRTEMSKPLDATAFCQSVPKGMEQQVYLMSLLGIRLDSQAEAQYLDHIARGMGITPDVANQVHDQVGMPRLYQ